MENKEKQNIKNIIKGKRVSKNPNRKNNNLINLLISNNRTAV